MPVLDRLVSISAGLVPGPALCPGAGAAERSQETLYGEIKNKNLNKKFFILKAAATNNNQVLH